MLLAGCDSSNPTDLFPSTMQAVGSATVTAKAGTAVTIQVRVLTDKNVPLGNIPVQWVPAQGDVVPVRSITDGSGVAATVWTLSTQTGTQTLAASAQFVSPVTFTATATQ